MNASLLWSVFQCIQWTGVKFSICQLVIQLVMRCEYGMTRNNDCCSTASNIGREIYFILFFWYEIYIIGTDRTGELSRYPHTNGSSSWLCSIGVYEAIGATNCSYPASPGFNKNKFAALNSCKEIPSKHTLLLQKLPARILGIHSKCTYKKYLSVIGVVFVYDKLRY